MIPQRQPNLFGGAASPTQLVQNYQARELGPLMNKQVGGTARPMGTPDLGVERQAPRMTLETGGGFDGVQRMVEQGHQASQARLEIKRRQATIAKQAAAQKQQGTPFAYRGVKRTSGGRGQQYVRQQVAQQGGNSLGGRYGIRKDASAAFTNLESAFSRVFGSGIPVQEGFRSLAKQQYLYDGWVRRLPGFNLAAKPGTSNHGSGIAVDLGGPFMNANSPQHRWLQANGPRFGWHWVGRTFSQVEPWHWEYHP